MFQALRKKGEALFGKSVGKALPLKQKAANFILKWWHLAAGGILVFLILYYPAGALIIHRIDTDSRFSDKNGKAVQVIGTLEDLIRRETGTHMFTPNKPFFYPSAVLDDMPAFQKGVITGIKNATEAFHAVNPDSDNLNGAAERLAYPSDVWHVLKWKPAVSSVKKYKKARAKLAGYQQNVSNGEESFNRSPQALATVLGRLETGIQNCIETLAGQMKVSDSRSDDVFYQTKGQAYVYSLILRDLKKDFEEEFKRESLEKKRLKTLDLLQNAVRMKPFFVLNGDPASPVLPNHLTGMGFDLSRAAYVLNEMRNDLRGEHE